MNKGKFIVRPTKNNKEAKAHGEWYFTVVAGNGKVVAISEVYNKRGNCMDGIKALQNALVDPVIEIDKSACINV